MSKILVSAENVYKKYCRNLKRSMFYGLHDITSDIFNIPGINRGLREHEFWVLSNISLQLKRGEVLGILGSNGAGKSTMLKLISGIIYPDAGSITTRGSIGELIEIAAGFHPLLTGKENIYIKGAILGMSKRQVDLVFDEIVEFAELEEFIDMPVKYYSSGMYMRLGFSVITHSKPDLLLIDETLSVGDVNFRAKCFNKISEIILKAGVIFVSHNMGDVSRVCSKIMVLKKGICIYYGDQITDGIDCYYRECSADNSLFISGSGKATINKICIEAENKDQSMTVHSPSDQLILNMTINVIRQVQIFEIVIIITNLEQQNIIQANSYYDSVKLINSSDQLSIRVNMGCLHLNPGVYGVTVAVHKENRGEVLAKYSNCLSFRISGNRIGYSALQVPAKWELHDY